MIYIIRAIRDLYRKYGKLNRHVHHLKEKLMNAVDELTQSVETLKNDVSTKLGEFDTEVEALEKQVAEGQTPDLTPLKTLVSETDDLVTSHVLPGTTGGTTTAPGGTDEGAVGGAPGESGSGGAAPTA